MERKGHPCPTELGCHPRTGDPAPGKGRSDRGGHGGRWHAVSHAQSLASWVSPVTLSRATLEQGMEPGSARLAGDEGSQWGWEGGWHALGLWQTRGRQEWERKGKGACRSQAIQQVAALVREAGFSPAPGAACPSERSPQGGGTQHQAPPRRPGHRHGWLLAVTRHRAPDQRETEAWMEIRGHQRHEGVPRELDAHQRPGSCSPSSNTGSTGKAYVLQQKCPLLHSKTTISLKGRRKKPKS